MEVFAEGELFKEANRQTKRIDDTKGCGDCGELHQEASGGLDWLQNLIKRHGDSPMHEDDRKVAVSGSGREENSIDDESRVDYETSKHGADSAVFDACKNGASDCKSRVNSDENARERAAGLMDPTSGRAKQTSSTRASQLHDARKVVRFLETGIGESEQRANVAVRAVQQAANLAKLLTEAAQTAQSGLQSSEQAAQGVEQELSAKRQLLVAAKNRVQQLLRELD